MTLRTAVSATIHETEKGQLTVAHTPVVVKTPSTARKKRVWLDIDNSPHVPFFGPIIEELRKLEIELLLTARNMYQVCELLDFYHLKCKVVGGHARKHTLLKVWSNCARALQLLPIVGGKRVDLAVSHGSRAQVLVSKLLGIPTLMMHDYEYSVKTGFLEPTWVMMPDVIPDGIMSRKTDRVVRYPGLKEDVYTPKFRPDPSILGELGLLPEHVVATVRPPATEAHYHNPESEVLFAETMRFLTSMPDVRTIILPRNTRQGEQVRAEWKEAISRGSVIVPSRPLDGLNVIWFSDLVVSGGGTMNREAAALGVPVYSIFRGKIGAVDHYLERAGRLVLIENTDDVRKRIKVERWKRPSAPQAHSNAVLQSIVSMIVSVLETNRPTQSFPSTPASSATRQERSARAAGAEL